MNNTNIEQESEQLSEKEKLEEVTKLIKVNAESGDAKYQYDLGMMFATGQGPYGHGLYTKSITQAKYWLEKSAVQGYTDAQNALGKLYEQAGDYANAIKYYELAVAQNHTQSIIDLAMLYGMGESVETDLKKAHELFLRAANQNDLLHNI